MPEPGRTETSEGIGLPSGQLHRGSRIGKYELLTLLSVGGMAELFLGFTAGPGGFRKYVVVKRILPDVVSQDQFVKMFLDEARITAAFNHPNISQVFDLGDEDGLFIAMEFIPGQNLNQVTAACLRRAHPVPFGFSCGMARDVCLALHYAHTFMDPTGKPSPVIHRDVAQKNIMVTYDGVTKLLDFGIAKVKGGLGRTNVGMVKGTTGYMSPEQVRAEELDGRSDLFAVGVVLHELLTGQRLFSAETEMEEMTKILQAPIPKPHVVDPNIPEAISEVVMRALARERADRFNTGKDMARALERAAGKLMFDQDRASAFMRELFAGKMEATRSLLESAGSDEDVHTATRAIREDSSAQPARPAKKKPAPVAPAEPARAPSPPPRAHAPMGKTPLPFDPAGAGAPSPAHPRRDASRFLEELRALWGNGNLRYAALGVGIVLGTLALVLIVNRTVPEDPLIPSEPPPVVMPVFTNKPSTANPPATDKRPTSAPQVSPQQPGPAVKAPAERSSKGTLTLVTLPPAQVFLNGREVGKTPLFKLELPAKTHLLKLVGPDGKTRVLSTPIRAGKNAQFKLKLEDLPQG